MSTAAFHTELRISTYITKKAETIRLNQGELIQENESEWYQIQVLMGMANSTLGLVGKEYTIYGTWVEYFISFNLGC